MAGLHVAIGQLIPVVTAVKGSMCSALSEKYSHGCTTQAQSKKSVSCMATFSYIHSLIDGHVHVSSAGTSVMKLLESLLFIFDCITLPNKTLDYTKKK